jgi:transposase
MRLHYVSPAPHVEQQVRASTADIACVGQRLILKLLVRKWVCPLDSCSQRIFAEPFAGLVRRYARMTDRLIKALQSVGVITNGADGACLSSSLAMPTTAKTLIRRVLDLPLPKEGSVRIAGIDEWAWKKGSSYGTILVDIEHRRVVALLPERSVETSKAWFKKHPEVEIVPRDRGKIFRAAADAGAPQAKQIVDRFHLQKNFGEALEKFFGHHKRLLKKAARQLAGKAPPSQAVVTQQTKQERGNRHALSAFVATRKSGSCFALDTEKRTSHRWSGLGAEVSIEHWKTNSLPPEKPGTGPIM